jgi:hypothetical protein
MVFNSYGANEKSVSAVSFFTAKTLKKNSALYLLAFKNL